MTILFLPATKIFFEMIILIFENKKIPLLIAGLVNIAESDAWEGYLLQTSAGGVDRDVDLGLVELHSDAEHGQQSCQAGGGYEDRPGQPVSPVGRTAQYLPGGERKVGLGRVKAGQLRPLPPPNSVLHSRRLPSQKKHNKYGTVQEC